MYILSKRSQDWQIIMFNMEKHTVMCVNKRNAFLCEMGGNDMFNMEKHAVMHVDNRNAFFM